MSEPYTLAELAAYADPSYGQHFLVNNEKLDQMMAAAGVAPTDRVLELGAGLGTVARRIPVCSELTLVELDSRFTEPLRAAVPGARIIQGDALALVQAIPFDVLFSNLPYSVTAQLLDLLPQLDFRVAVIAMGEQTDLADLQDAGFRCELVVRIGGTDFSPPQRPYSRVVRVWRSR